MGLCVPPWPAPPGHIPALMAFPFFLPQVLGREVYTSNNQLGGIQIMHNNGVTHGTVCDDFEGVYTILQWLSYMPKVIPGPAELQGANVGFVCRVLGKGALTSFHVSLFPLEYTQPCSRPQSQGSYRQNHRLCSHQDPLRSSLDAGWTPQPKYGQEMQQLSSCF